MVLAGRARTNLAGGIVGLANVGKSTFFQALTRSTLGNPANFPFATIDPEEARVVVPSRRLDVLAEVYKPSKVVPASLEVVDIAGLVRGAANGDGLGNAFLSHIRAVDGLFQMVRAFDDEDIVHVEQSVDPVRDAQIIHDELVLKDMEFVMKAMEQTQRKARSLAATSTAGAEASDMLRVCEKAMGALDRGQRVDTGVETWVPRDMQHLRQLNLLTMKPSVYVANISEEDWCFGSATEPARDLADWVASAQPGSAVVPVSVNFESRMARLSDAERAAELAELGDVTSALPHAIMALREALGLHSFFTAGADEVREWTIQQGATAPEAAAAIHNDLARTFVAANVTKFEEAVAAGGDEAVLKRAGKIATKGKDYVVADGDLLHVRAAAARR